MSSSERYNRRSSGVREACIYAMLASILFASKIAMEALPNVHLLGTLTMTYTVVLRKKALIPLYLYVIINGVYAGFAAWWVPYLYIWTVLWAVTMLLPRNMPRWVACIVYPTVCCLHGILFGVLYAPGQALMFGFDLKQTLAWIAAGLPFDIIHGVSNGLTGILVYPLSRLLRKLMARG